MALAHMLGPFAMRSPNRMGSDRSNPCWDRGWAYCGVPLSGKKTWIDFLGSLLGLHHCFSDLRGSRNWPLRAGFCCALVASNALYEVLWILNTFSERQQRFAPWEQVGVVAVCCISVIHSLPQHGLILVCQPDFYVEKPSIHVIWRCFDYRWRRCLMRGFWTMENRGSQCLRGFKSSVGLNATLIHSSQWTQSNAPRALLAE